MTRPARSRIPQSHGTATLPAAPSARGTSFHPVPLHIVQFSSAILAIPKNRRSGAGLDQAGSAGPLSRLRPAYGRTTSSASCLLWESCGSLCFCGGNKARLAGALDEERKTDDSRTFLPHHLRSRSHNRMPRRPLPRIARRHARQLLLDHLGELAHLFLHLDHLFPHI